MNSTKATHIYRRQIIWKSGPQFLPALIHLFPSLPPFSPTPNPIPNSHLPYFKVFFQLSTNHIMIR